MPATTKSASWRERVKQLTREFKQRAAIYRAVARHPRTPRYARYLLLLALAYALMPFDLIPDWIPVLGFLDDLIIVPLLVWLALRAVPKDVYEECERAAMAGMGKQEPGIETGAGDGGNGNGNGGKRPSTQINADTNGDKGG